MSWFETTGFTSLARSALKEAQKTIDKALDIKDPDVPAEDLTAVKLKEGSDSFFAEFGFGSKKSPEAADAPSGDVSKGSSGSGATVAASLWGSFTGSFSESAASSSAPATTSSKKEVVAVQPITSSRRPDPLPPVEEVTSPSTDTDCTMNVSPLTSNSKDTSIPPTSNDIESTNSLQGFKLNPSSKESFNSIFSSDLPSSASPDHCSILKDKPQPMASLWDGSANDSKEFVTTSLPVSSSGVPNKVGEEEVDWGWGSGITDSMVDGILQQQDEELKEGLVGGETSDINTVSSTSCESKSASSKLAEKSDLPSSSENLKDTCNKELTQSSDTKESISSVLVDDDTATSPCGTQEVEQEVSNLSLDVQPEVSSPDENSSEASNECMRSASSGGAATSSISDGSGSAGSGDSTMQSSDSFAVISSATSSSIDTIEEFQSPRSPTSPQSSDDQDHLPLQVSSIVDSKKSSPFSSHSRADAPLTVQPSKSPLKMNSVPTVIDAQVTRGEAGTPKSTGSRWGGSSATSDSDHSDTGSESTEVSAGTITTQPVGVADSTSIGWDNQKWDGTESTTSGWDGQKREITESIATSWDGQKWEGVDSTTTSWESQKWDSCSEDMSASESVQSSSSVVTLMEGSSISASDDLVSLLPERSSLTNVHIGKLGTATLGSSQFSDRELEIAVPSEVENLAKSSTNIPNPKPIIVEPQIASLSDVISSAPGRSHDLNLSPRANNEVSEAENSFLAESSIASNELDGAKAFKGATSLDSGTELPVSVPLDVSVESGGSSDTITASMDSAAFAGACGDDGEWSTLGDETPVPHLIKEAICEGKSSNKAPGTDLPNSHKSEAEHADTQSLACDALQKSYVEVDEEFDASCPKGQKLALEPDEAPDHSSSRDLHPGPQRDLSPSSSDSLTSEMVKVGGSEQTSGHTSGDEFETTTSSDIEVISSPSLDGVSVYGGMYNNMGPGGTGGGVLLGPAHNTASRVWHSAQQRLKSFLVEPSGANGSSKGSYAGSAGDRGETVVSPSMTASFTSISESDGGGEVWGMLGGTTSPPRAGQKKGDATSQHYFERGHTRNESTLSETSESSSEHLSPEAEKLSKRVRELTEVLETREQRLLELSQQNVCIQDQNHALQLRVQELEASGGGGGEGVEEEYTQRLATMEKKFQQALREKEMLSKQLEALRTETATRLSSSEVQQQLQERDTVISELRSEGEKLSKQQLTYSTTIKKLRAKEKELEAANTSQSAKIESQQTEIERQHKQLVAKCEVERRQVSAITQLTGQLQQLQERMRAVTAEAAETQGKMDVLRDALDAAYRELGEVKRQESARAAELAEVTLSAEVGAKQQLQEALQQQQKLAGKEKQALLLQLEEMQEEKERIQQAADRSERMLRNEVMTLQQQLSDSEGRGEQLSTAVAAATRPLLRQIESLQSTHASHRSAWEELEAQLTHRLQEAEKQAAASAERQRNISDHSAQAIAQQAAMQAKVEHLKEDNATLAAKVQTLSSAVSRLEEEKASVRAEAGAARETLLRDLAAAKAECGKLKAQLEVELTALDAEKKRNETLHSQVAELEAKKGVGGNGGGGGNNGGYSRQSSPTPSLSRLSVSGSINSFMAGPYSDDVFEGVGWGGSLRQHSSVYEALRSNTTTTVEALTSQLSQREGEVQLLQSEVVRHEAQRESLASELLQLTEQVLQLQQQQDEHKQLKQQHQDIAQKYNALLQMYGEKVEEVDELRLDLADVKEMYKAQINQLMQQ